MKTISKLLAIFTLSGAVSVRAAEEVPAAKAVSMNHGYFRVDDRIAVQPFGKKPTKLLRYFDKTSPEALAEAEKAMGRKLTPCTKVDPDSFYVLNFNYTRDDDRAFYRFLRVTTIAILEIPEVDADSFVAIDYFTAKDKNRVWYQTLVIEGADPETFQPVHGEFYKDKNRVYLKNKPVEGADPATFVSIEKTYYRDKDRVYCGIEALPDADPEKFKAMALRNLGKDRERVYMYHHLLPDVNASTFVQMKDVFYKDKNKVYILPTIKGKLRLIPLESADPSSFFVVIDDVGQDKTQCFVYEKEFKDVYVLKKTGDDVLIEKTIWFVDEAKFMPEKAGTVKAELKNERVMFPKVELDDAYKEKIDAAEEVKKIEFPALVEIFNKSAERFLK